MRIFKARAQKKTVLGTPKRYITLRRGHRSNKRVAYFTVLAIPSRSRRRLPVVISVVTHPFPNIRAGVVRVFGVANDDG